MYADPMNSMEPAQMLGPHVAALGMTFYQEKPYSTGMMFPSEPPTSCTAVLQTRFHASFKPTLPP